MNDSFNKKWNGKWIVDERFVNIKPINIFHKEMEEHDSYKHEENLKNQHMLVRKTFKINKPYEKAYIDITADDYYKLYINGSYVGQGPAPGYHYHYYYNRHEISNYLVEGENIIGVHVYYQGLINRVWNSGDYRQGLIGEVEIDDEVCLITDNTWKYIVPNYYLSNETIGNKTQYVEDIDCSLVEKKWTLIDYNDAHWCNAVEISEDDHSLFLQESDSISVYKVKPKIIKELSAGHFYIDIGQEITGYIEMKASGRKGDTVQLLCGEELEDATLLKVRYEMRCNCIYKEKWILSGDEDVLEHFDYKAFRYAEIIAPNGVVDLNSIVAVVRHYPFDDAACIFHSSNDTLNSIWDICRNGVKYGTQEVYVDCPSREKGQYLGDFTVTGNAHIYLSGNLKMYKKTLRDFALSSKICPGLMAVAPGGFMQEIADFSLQWPGNLLLYYKHSGDIEFLKEMYPVAEGVLKYFRKYKRSDGLLENVKEKWNLVDWPKNLRDEYDFELTKPIKEGCHNVINAFYIGAEKTLIEIKDILQINNENEKHIIDLKNRFLEVFYNRENGLFVDAEGSRHSAIHSNFLPLYFNLIAKDDTNAIIKLIEEKKFACGVYNAYFLLKGLANVGQHKLVYQLIINNDENSWVNMIKEGATTCFEAWGKEMKWNTSLCHPWASAPISVLIEDIIGLYPSKPGWEEIGFKPNIPKEIENLFLEVSVRTGVIKVEYKDGILNIDGPSGIN